VTAAASIAACGGGTSLTTGADAGGSRGTIDATSHSSGEGGSPDEAGARGDDATDADDAADGGEAGTPAYGDRNLQLEEPYPDSVLIQNGGRFYNVRKPPPGTQHVAAGDGVTDDTDALRDAFDFVRDAYVAAGNAGHLPYNADDLPLTDYWIYLPAGTYRVVDTITYRQAIVLADGGSYPDLARIRIAGESRESTVIKLDDAAAGFGDPSHPKTLLAYQRAGTSYNGVPSTNLLKNLSVDTGSGNPGAVALWWQGANTAQMYNVLLRSADGQGFCGLLVQTGATHGYSRDITVDGFDDGICQIATPGGAPAATPNVDSHTALEHVTLQRQNKSGVLLEAGGTSLRKLLVDESSSGAVAVTLAQGGATMMLDDSLLRGNAAAGAAIQRDRSGSGQVLVARDVVTSGYSGALSAAGSSVISAPNIDEYVSSPTVTFTADGGVAAGAATLRLPVEDTPLAPWYDPATDWADVDKFPDGGADDTVAIQAAMNSGKPVVVFPRAMYVFQSVTIPATVRRVDGMFAVFQGRLVISEASATPLEVTYHQKDAIDGIITRAAARPLVLRMHGGDLINQVPADLFLENTTEIGERSDFTPPGQSTWARFMDQEETAASPVDIWAAGGTLWLFGFKTENEPVTSFLATDGGRMEVLNGEVAQIINEGTAAIVRNDDSDVSFFGFTDVDNGKTNMYFTHIVEEQRGDASAAILFTGTVQPPLVPRGWRSPGNQNVELVVPLYSGRLADAGN
jgi:hypothetical protein